MKTECFNDVHTENSGIGCSIGLPSLIPIYQNFRYTDILWDAETLLWQNHQFYFNTVHQEGIFNSPANCSN